MKKLVKFILGSILTVLFFPTVVLFMLVAFPYQWSRSKKGKPRLFWGVTPIKTYAYWAQALQRAGYTSKTVMKEIYAINKRSDFDLLFEDLVPLGQFLPKELSRMLGSHIAFFYAVLRFDIFCTTFDGMFFEGSPLHRVEGQLLHFFGKKIIVIPYGGDSYMYGKVAVPSLQHVLLMSYPDAGRKQPEMERRVSYWSAHADFMFCGLMIDGFPRWDALPLSIFSIDERDWMPRQAYNLSDGTGAPVVIVHAPNHRGFKGTEYIIKAIEELRQEGWNIDFRLLEKLPNEQIKAVLGEADILVDQIVAFGYALNAIEGMARGCVVLSNLTDPPHRALFSRYSFLEECPIVSTNHENLKSNLRFLIRHPELRAQRGRDARAYMEKYHSMQAGVAFFEGIYADLANPGSRKMMNFFHPIMPDSYNNRYEKIKPVPLDGL